MQLVLDVWREACRHIEVAQSIDRIAQVIAPHFPAELLIVRRIDLEHQGVETVAVGMCRAATPPVHKRTECTAGELRELAAWCATGRIIAGGEPGNGDPLVRCISPSDAHGQFIAGPLALAGGPIGVVIVMGTAETHFTSEHVSRLQGLLEPFSVALANDARFHELARLREALEADKRALLSRLERTDVMDAIVGADSGLASVMDRLQQVAPTDAPVLLLGETGAGKEVIARAIHARSHRAQGPMVRVNCGALPKGLVDSELFGHERGSFTGAVSSRKGWFERADGGTLFLDEIAELPLDAQVRLLRIVQDGTFERVGGQKPITVDVRIVAATHRDLAAMVAAGEFREDLWYRIGVFPIRLPPLRERIEDIPALAAHFAWRAGLRLAGAPLTVSPDDVAVLVGYSWPGNVRELAAVIERAAILGDGRALRIAAALGAPASARSSRALASSSARRGVPAEPVRGPSPSPISRLDDATRRHIESALAASLGRIEGPFGAAMKLGVNPHTLRARMRKLSIDWRRFRGNEARNDVG